MTIANALAYVFSAITTGFCIYAIRIDRQTMRKCKEVEEINRETRRQNEEVMLIVREKFGDYGSGE